MHAWTDNTTSWHMPTHTTAHLRCQLPTDTHTHPASMPHDHGHHLARSALTSVNPPVDPHPLPWPPDTSTLDIGATVAPAASVPLDTVTAPEGAIFANNGDDGDSVRVSGSGDGSVCKRLSHGQYSTHPTAQSSHLPTLTDPTAAVPKCRIHARHRHRPHWLPLARYQARHSPLDF